MFFSLDGQYAIQALEPGKLTFKQIESCRRTLRRNLGKTAQVWLRSFTSIPVSKKAVASRMGKVKAHFLIEFLLLSGGKFLLKLIVLDQIKQIWL